MNLLGEVMAVFQGQKASWDQSEGYARSFSEGLKRVLRCWAELHFVSFNMAIYLSLSPQKGLYTFARMAPRATLAGMETSDVNYYEKLHGESFSVFAPEEMCTQIRPYFVGQQPSPSPRTD
jgi:hypothetical protein